MNFQELAVYLQDHLLNRIVPFWLNRAMDWEYGGIFTGIADNGTINTTDKFIWSNARAIYTFSALYNRIDRNPRWLEAAGSIFEFCHAHGRTENGWVFLVDRQGHLLEGEKAIQVDAFAIMGLTEYARACADPRAVQAALETYDSVRQRLAQPGSYGTFPYPIPPGAKAHRDYFQFALAFFELGRFLDRRDILSAARGLAEEVMDHFRRPEDETLREYITTDNRCLDSPAGRAMVPGHTLESMWFMIHIFHHFEDQNRIAQAVETIRWAVEKGWDPEYGGLFLGIDSEGRQPPYWKNAETKIWWVFSEALYALLLAYAHGQAPWCLDWYWKVHDWTFAHFPDQRHGEWTQKLDRKGEPIDTVIALPVKDPFHLPRALILCIELLKTANWR